MVCSECGKVSGYRTFRPTARKLCSCTLNTVQSSYMGAKKKPAEERRSERLDIRLTPKEHKVLTEAASLDGADSMSEWVRHVLVKMARKLLRKG